MRCAARRCDGDATVAISRGGDGVVQVVACERHADVAALFEPAVRVRELRGRDVPPERGVTA